MIENIKDEISGKLVIISDGMIQYGKNKIKLSDIIDFNYSHNYYNGSGGLSFELLTNTGGISFYAESSPMKRIFKGTSTENNMKKLEALMNQLLPIASRNFVDDKVKKILSGYCIQIWQIIFCENRIELQTRFWKKNVIFNYHRISFYYRNHRLGMFGGKGTANYLYIKDENTGKEFRYSRNPEHQARPSDYQKIQLLLSAMEQVVENKKSSNNDNFKPLI